MPLFSLTLNKKLIMNTNLTKNIIAICTAISLSLLSSFTIAAETEGLTKQQKSAMGGILKEIEQSFIRDCKKNVFKACLSLADGYTSKKFDAPQSPDIEDGVDTSFIIATSAYKKACEGGIVEACSKRVELDTKLVQLCKSRDIKSCFTLGATSTTGVNWSSKGKPDYDSAVLYYNNACNLGMKKACDLALLAKNKIEKPSKSGHQVVQGVGAIESPDGLYQVTESAVYQIKVTEKNSYGQYKFNSYIIERASKHSNYYKHTEFSKRHKVGDHVVNGLWTPDSQQFYASYFEKVLQAQQCNFWTDPDWSFSYIPTTFQLNGREVSAWKSINSYSNNRKPKRSCDWVQIDRKTCKVECTKWIDATPSSYLFENKSDAIEYLKDGKRLPTVQSKPKKAAAPSEKQIQRSKMISDNLRKQAKERKAKQKRAEELTKARAKEKSRQAALKEEQRLENERKAAARKAAQKKNEEYSSAIQALVKESSEKLKVLEIEHRKKIGAPPRLIDLNGDNRISPEEKKAHALAYEAYIESSKNKPKLSREEHQAARLEQRAARQEYTKARKKVEAEYQEAKAKLLKEKQ